MITYENAIACVLREASGPATISVPLEQSQGYILAEDILADRDFPPFDRATKDGIALVAEAAGNGRKVFEIEGIAAAGSAQKYLQNPEHCLEVMTGAVVPEGADAVVMYEDLEIHDGKATLLKPVKKGMNIHKQGSDTREGEVVLKSPLRISPAETGVLASVGKSFVKVFASPKVAVVATGNELVKVDSKPLPHQIRRSNTLTLKALLEKERIQAALYYLNDDKDELKAAIGKLLEENDVLLLSGGVSRGKYDYLPEVFESLGVSRIFHRVAQRPGKPLWFGKHETWNTTVFSFPGNPVSAFSCYHHYFLPWLDVCMGMHGRGVKVRAGEHLSNDSDLTSFKRVRLALESGRLIAYLVKENGSGDLTSLVRTDGFIRLSPGHQAEEGDLVDFTPTRTPAL
ncbi:molybdopterin molybdotransferase MoeA [Robertkochia aurantiaca]|uniref:molybdopterin molybdotransferase MoeA n=1 Tax=Robertkochia aurantiaca TaxID=2873700 RepID=UPI001CCB4B0A|nr:molybdopterin molybdotransferase MoeA [Robertkochia sp. 3YJGBD-33]